MPDASAYLGPVLVTVAYIALYYAFQVWLLVVKQRVQKAHEARGERFDRYFSQDRELLAADRVQLNTLEHMPPFLLLLWLNAVFVGTFSATIAGAIYVAARALYPSMIGRKLGRGIKASIFLSTAPGYGVLAWYCGALVYAAL